MTPRRPGLWTSLLRRWSALSHEGLALLRIKGRTLAFISRYCLAGNDKQQIPAAVEAVFRDPAAFVNDELRAEIAAELFVESSTVKSHVAGILAKLYPPLTMVQPTKVFGGAFASGADGEGAGGGGGGVVGFLRRSGRSFARVVEFQSQPGFLGGMWFGFLMPVSAFIFLVALFAETNRQPFDTVESEADLVGSFHTEYGAFKWGLFFVAEYSHMIVGSGVFMLLFGGGWNPLPWVSLADLVGWLTHLSPLAAHPLFVGILSIAIFMGKVLAMIFFFMWVRWTLPRFRYDQVMKIGWQKMLPLSIANLLFYAIAIALIQK